MIALKEQDKDDDNGIEHYVRRCMETDDVEWFPKKRAMCLKVDGKKSAEELMGELRDDLGRLIHGSERVVVEQNDIRVTSLQRTFEQLSKHQTHTQGKLDDLTVQLRSQGKVTQNIDFTIKFKMCCT